MKKRKLKKTKSLPSKAQSRIGLNSLFNRLFAYNRNVDDYNQQKLDALMSPAVEFVSEDSSGRNEVNHFQ